MSGALEEVGCNQIIFYSPLKTQGTVTTINHNHKGTISKINLRHLKADMTFSEKPLGISPDTQIHGYTETRCIVVVEFSRTPLAFDSAR